MSSKYHDRTMTARDSGARILETGIFTMIYVYVALETCLHIIYFTFQVIAANW